MVQFFFIPFTVLARTGQELHQISIIVSFKEFAIDRPNSQSILIDNFISFVGIDFLNHITTILFGKELIAHVF
jgi:hypothetical protein